MPLTEVSTSSIEIIFEGLLVLCLDTRSQTTLLSQCAVHIPDHAPEHRLEISLQQRRDDGSYNTLRAYRERDLSRYFSLAVTGAATPGFSFETGFFDKAVDLETSDFYDKRINFRPAAVASTFYFNNGRFRTVGDLSVDRLVISRGSGPRTPKRQVALKLAADISLPSRLNSRATFANGDDLFLFKPEGQPSRILISHTVIADDHSTPHAENYNRVIATDEAEADRIHFHPDDTFKAGAEDEGHPHREHLMGAPPLEFELMSPPHAVCFSAILGRGTQ